ncbi:MAG: glutathione S-transferase family protein [Micropepsaceae bacterium]
MIKVHHLNNSRSHRVLWLLEELGLPYEIVAHKRDLMTRLAPPELKKVHPLGKSPVIVDDGLVVAESGAIIEYLTKKHGHGKLWPADSAPNWVAHTHWMHFAEGSAMLPFLLALYAGMLGDNAAALRPRIEGEIANHLSYMDGALAKHDYFAGNEFTACDIQMSFILEVADTGGRLKDYPRLTAVLKRYRERPGYQRAIEKGGPLELIRR